MYIPVRDADRQGAQTERSRKFFTYVYPKISPSHLDVNLKLQASIIRRHIYGIARQQKVMMKS